MLAYIFGHRPYATTTVKQYEEALLRFQQHLGQQHPPGFTGSASSVKRLRSSRSF
jgi:hypothetical protein